MSAKEEKQFTKSTPESFWIVKDKLPYLARTRPIIGNKRKSDAFQKGETIEVNEEIRNILIKKGWAKDGKSSK